MLTFCCNIFSCFGCAGPDCERSCLLCSPSCHALWVDPTLRGNCLCCRWVVPCAHPDLQNSIALDIIWEKWLEASLQNHTQNPIKNHLTPIKTIPLPQKKNKPMWKPQQLVDRNCFSLWHIMSNRKHAMWNKKHAVWNTKHILCKHIPYFEKWPNVSWMEPWLRNLTEPNVSWMEPWLRNLTFHECNLHFGTSRNLMNGTLTSEPLKT